MSLPPLCATVNRDRLDALGAINDADIEMN